MYKILFGFVFTLTAFTAAAQVKKKISPAPAQAIILKSAEDSVSYAIGMSLASFYKKQGIEKVNTVLLERAVNDVLKSKPTLMNEQQANNCMIGYMQKAQSEKASGNKKEGAAFLAANKLKQGVIVRPSGLQYMIIKEGTGPKPANTSKVKVHYHGTLLDGSVFDSSVDRGQPIEMSVREFISGWQEALQLMPVGSKWRLFVPADLAYGDQSTGLIKPGSTLIFDIELLDIMK